MLNHYIGPIPYQTRGISISKAEIKKDLKFTPWKVGDQEAKRYVVMLTVFLVLATLWVAVMVSSSFYKGIEDNWLTAVFAGVIWVAFGPFIIFQIRYGIRVNRLLKDAHHKSFKRRRMFTKHDPVKQVDAGIKSILKKEKMFATPDNTKFRIPEVGMFKKNLYLKKQGIRIIIKKHKAMQMGDGAILLLPEKTTQQELDELKALIEDAFE